MKKLVTVLVGVILLGELAGQQQPPKGFNNKSIDAWHEKVKEASYAPIVSYEVFEGKLEEYLGRQRDFLAGSSWLGEKIDIENGDLSNDSRDELEQPFALKVAIKSGGSGYFWGDIHGDVKALVASFKKLKDKGVINDAFEIIQPDTYFFFLGDMVDRGMYQIDALWLIINFAFKNLGKVFLIRGNHEDLRLSNDYGFNDQLKELYRKAYGPRKFSEKTAIYSLIGLFYNLMPDVAFVGCNNNYLQCCHGGIEIRYNPKELLGQPGALRYQLIERTEENNSLLNTIVRDISVVNRLSIDSSGYGFLMKNFIKPRDPFLKYDFGFLWGDFNPDPQENYKTFYNKNRGLFAGKNFTQDVLKYYSSDIVRVRAIMRAHQHNETLPGILNGENSGVYPIWQNSVITNLSTSIFNGVIAFNQITFDDNYDNWRLTNYSGKGNVIDAEKTNLLKDWKNNYEPSVKEKPIESAISTMTISQENEKILARVDNEIEREYPNYKLIEKMLKSVTADPQDKPSEGHYVRAQKLLKIFYRLIYAIALFEADDYATAKKSLSQSLEWDIFKFKACEYYTKAIIAAKMKDEYDVAMAGLMEILSDKSISLQDQLIAVGLVQQLGRLKTSKEK